MIPLVPIEPLALPQLGPHHDDLWTTLCDLGDAHHEDWVIIGGQMVMLHALQTRREPGRISQDLDTVIDARVRPPALPAFLATLANLGFKSAGVSPDEVARRRPTVRRHPSASEILTTSPSGELSMSQMIFVSASLRHREMAMAAVRRIALITTLVGSASLFGCASDEHPSVREVAIMSDTELSVSVWCAQKAQPYVLITETATEVRLHNQYAAPDHTCSTSEDLTLQAPLGTRNIVDERDGHTIPVRSDYRCGDADGGADRCDGIDTPPPPALGNRPGVHGGRRPGHSAESTSECLPRWALIVRRGHQWVCRW